MSLTSGFFDAMEQGEGNYDRVYTAAEFAHYFSLLVGNGVFPSPDTGLNVLASDPANMTVKIGDGSGWINGYFVTVAGGHSVTLKAASGTGTRIDSIIMQWNSNDRKINIIAKSGTVSGDPKPVDLQRDAELWELELAQITVGAGVSSVDQTKIKDMRSDETRCGLVTALLKGIDPSSFLRQSEAEFNKWFETVMNKISDEDVAGSLLKMITEVDNREKDHYTKISEKIDGSLDKASMLKSENDEPIYKKIHVAMKYMTDVLNIPVISGYSPRGTIWHYKTKRLFMLAINSASNVRKCELQLRYINSVTGKWGSTAVTVTSDDAYYSYYQLVVTNGEYAVVQFTYSSTNAVYIYKCKVASNGSISLTQSNYLQSFPARLYTMGQPFEGIPVDRTKVMLLSSNIKIVLDLSDVSVETFTTPTTYTDHSVTAYTRIPFTLSDGSIVGYYSSGFGIITPDKKEYRFPNKDIIGEGCIDKTGKYIYIPCKNEIVVISTEDYTVVKTISVTYPFNNCCNICLFEGKLYSGSLQEYLDDDFQTVSAPTYLSSGGMIKGYKSSSTILGLGLESNSAHVDDEFGKDIGGVIVTHGTTIAAGSNMFLSSNKTTTKGVVVVED